MKIKTTDVIQSFRDELQLRCLSGAPGDFAHHRDKNDVPLYGVTGAANLHAQLGLPMGDFQDRQAWANRINAFQQPDGTFSSPSGKEHAAAMAIIALNLLGGVPGRPVRHLAPTTADKLDGWLSGLDWTGTHKDFGHGVAPILASGFYGPGWLDVLRRNVEGRLSEARPLDVWCRPDDPPWRVVSCIYHVTEGFDAGFLPYPFPRMLWDRLMGLGYDTRRDDDYRTICTDFDYVFVLERLCYQLPDRFPDFIRCCRGVLAKRIVEWHERRGKIFAEASTHDLYCYAVGWALFQRVLPGDFEGPGLLDTLNVPWVFRLSSRELVTEE